MNKPTTYEERVREDERRRILGAIPDPDAIPIQGIQFIGKTVSEILRDIRTIIQSPQSPTTGE